VRNGNRSYDNQARDKVAFGLYLSQQHNDEPFYEKPIHLEVTFYMPIPKPINERKLTHHHSAKPYLDNLYKSFLEAIKNILIVDDRVICSLSMKKVYDKEPRTEVIITEVT
jgi:Holliday junction resolvase RusA-like endonuclease